MRTRHDAQATVLGGRRSQAEPDRGHVRVFQLFRDAVLMPADKRIAVAEFIKDARGLEQDVRTDELLHAVEHARMRGQLPGPAKIEMRPVEARDAAAERAARLLDLGAKTRDLIRREDGDRVEETQLVVFA